MEWRPVGLVFRQMDTPFTQTAQNPVTTAQRPHFRCHGLILSLYLKLHLGLSSVWRTALVYDSGWCDPGWVWAVPKPEPPQAHSSGRTRLLPLLPAFWSPPDLSFHRIWQQWVRILLETPVLRHKTFINHLRPMLSWHQRSELIVP